jgi:5-hydroxyisourate hydrolase-like protein (transthyretin family)
MNVGMRLMLFRSAALAALLLSAALPALAAGPLTGTVTDRTTGKPAAGDTVSLIAFGKGMQVAAHTTTDAQGRFTLQIPDDSMHLVRVDHEKATYFEPAPPGTRTVKIDVYDVAAKVKGVATEADVLSMQTQPSGDIHVTDDFFVRNDSKPAMTQFSNHAYEFFLPSGAKLEGTAAMGPGGMPVESTPVPLAGNGHYAFIFPVRPGESRFQISYTVPYNGKSLTWTQREAVATENLVLMLPKSMQFSSTATDWQTVQEPNVDAQVFVRKNVAPLNPVAFTIAGLGALPRDAQAAGTADSSSSGTPAGASEATGRPGGGLGPPIDTPDPLHRYKGWLLAAMGILLLLGAWWMMRSKPDSRPDSQKRESDRKEEDHLPEALRPTVPLPASSIAAEGPGASPLSPRSANPRQSFRQALEDSLLALERDYALGRMGEAEVTENRSTLQRMLHRILAREAQPEASLETDQATRFVPEPGKSADPETGENAEKPQ